MLCVSVVATLRVRTGQTVVLLILRFLPCYSHLTIHYKAPSDRNGGTTQFMITTWSGICPISIEKIWLTTDWEINVV